MPSAFLRASAGAVVVSAARAVSGLVVTKLIAVHAGPAGLALVGQFQSFFAVASTLANGGVTNGVVKQVAQRHGDPQARLGAFRYASLATLGVSVPVAIATVLACDPISKTLFGTIDYSAIIAATGVLLPLLALGSTWMAGLNGLKAVGLLYSAQICISIATLLAAVALVPIMGARGGMIATVAGLSTASVVALALLSRTPLSSWFPSRSSFHSPHGRELWGFALMAIATSVTLPISQILIRDLITREVSLEAAGMWQGVTRVSEVYLSIFTTALSAHYLPTIAGIASRSRLAVEVRATLLSVLVLVAICAAAIYLLRDLVITLVFTEAFRPMRDFFAWQLAGDVLRAAAWVFALLMVGRGRTVLFIGLEVGFAALWVLSSAALVPGLGVDGALLAYFIAYLAYLAGLLIYFRWEWRSGFAS